MGGIMKWLLKNAFFYLMVRGQFRNVPTIGKAGALCWKLGEATLVAMQPESVGRLLRSSLKPEPLTASKQREHWPSFPEAGAAH